MDLVFLQIWPVLFVLKWEQSNSEKLALVGLPETEHSKLVDTFENVDLFVFLPTPAKDL